MSALTRRRDPDVREECWQVYSGDVRVGTIAISTGNPDDTPHGSGAAASIRASHPGECTTGTAATFEGARGV